MLILTRRVGESLSLSEFREGDEVTVSVVEVKGNQVRIGITAPRHVSVDRDDQKQGAKDGNDAHGRSVSHEVRSDSQHAAARPRIALRKRKVPTQRD